jgi:peptidoglycan/LPS O-acetylase OafA/YrhL
MLLLNKTLNISSDYITTFNFILNFLIGILLYKNIGIINNLYYKLSPAIKFIIFIIFLFIFVYASGLINILHITDLYKTITFYIITSISSAIFIIYAINSTIFSKFLLLNSLQFLGKISYSLYLTHAIVLFSLVYILHGVIENYQIAILGFVVSIISATIFYNLVEKYSINLLEILLLSRW